MTNPTPGMFSTRGGIIPDNDRPRINAPMKMIKRFFYRLGGADYNIIKDCSSRTKWAYLGLGGASIVATLMGFAGGFEVAHQFTPNLYADCGAGALWGGLTLWYDFSIINGPKRGGKSKYLRIIGGIAGVCITVSACLVFLNQDRIDGKIRVDNSDLVKTLDDDYLGAKEKRYQAVTDKRAQAEKYKTDVVLPEARRGYPGPRYIEKKAAYDLLIKEITTETGTLNSAEEQYRVAYQSKRDALTSVGANDFFTKLLILPPILLSGGWLSLAVAGCFLIALATLDLGAISMKLSMPDDDEYHKNEKDYEDLMRDARAAGAEANAELEKRRVALGYRADRRRLQEEEHDLSMQDVEDLIVREARVRRTIAVLRERGYTTSVEKLEETLRDLGPSSAQNDGARPIGESIRDNMLALSMSMRETLKNIEADPGTETISKRVYAWIADNIKYDDEHGKFFCRTARETYNDRHGVCSELAVLYMAFLRATGVEAYFVAVDVDDKEKEVKHACVMIKDLDKSFLSDPAYHSYEIEHKQWEIWDDERLFSQFQSWNM